MKNNDVARAAANLVWLGLERLVQIAVAILISGLLARYFGPDIFGKWQYANTLLLVLAPLTWVCGAEILVPTIVHRRAEALAQSGDEFDTGVGTVLGSAFALRFGVSLAALVLTWGVLAAGVTDRLVAAMLAGLALTMVFREPFVGVVNAWLQSETYSKPQLLTSMASALVKAGLVYLLVRRAFAPAGFGWLWALEAAAISAVLLAYYRRRHHGRLGWHVDGALLRHFARAGLVFWIGLVCMYLFLKLDRLMLERYISYADLGRYAAAQQLNENWITLALMLAQTLAPAFIYRIHELAHLRRNIWRLLGLTALLMAAGAVALSLAGGLIVRLVFGPGFEAATDIFRWAVWLSVPAGIEAISNLIVLKYQAKYVLLGKWVLALAVAFVVDRLAIPALGGHGALLGLAAGYLAAVAVNLAYIRFALGPGGPASRTPRASVDAHAHAGREPTARERAAAGARAAAADGLAAAAAVNPVRPGSLDDVVVLLPAFNCQAALERTLYSFAEGVPVRVLIVDDGSSPPLGAPPIAGLSIEILRLARNGGIERALAAGVERIAAMGALYAARIDAGDRAWPGRLGKQRAFLDQHPEVDALGMWARVVDPTGAPLFMLTPPAAPAAIRRLRFARSCFVHPAMMLRISAVLAAGNYRDRYRAAEDFDLFLRIMENGECANLVEPGIDYELNQDGISATRRRTQIGSTLALQWHYREPANPYYWLGFAKNLLHLVVPYALLARAKRLAMRGPSPSGQP